jgi:hypothetical protein
MTQSDPNDMKTRWILALYGLSAISEFWAQELIVGGGNYTQR